MARKFFSESNIENLQFSLSAHEVDVLVDDKSVQHEKPEDIKDCDNLFEQWLTDGSVGGALKMLGYYR